MTSIWIVTANNSQKLLCEASLGGAELRFFPSWEALIAELVVTAESFHPRFCFLYDFYPNQTKQWLPMLRDGLNPASDIVLFGPAADLVSMQRYFQENLIIDYLGLPLNAARVLARFERGKLKSA